MSWYDRLFYLCKLNCSDTNARFWFSSLADEFEILKLLRNKSKLSCIEICDREKAIHYAIDLASSNDIILIAGKGHEDYQIIGTEKIAFCDKNIALNYCKLKYSIIYWWIMVNEKIIRWDF